MDRYIKLDLLSISLLFTLVLYPFAKIFSLGSYEPFYIIPGGIFATLGLYKFFQVSNRIIPKVFYLLSAFVILALIYNIGYTIFGDYNHLYNAAVYIFLSLFFFSLFYYIQESVNSFSNIFLISTGLCVLFYIIYFLLDGITIGYNSTFMYNINQFAFWAFLSFIILEMINYSKRYTLLKRIVQFFLFLFVLFTLSRSATMGIIIFVLLTYVNYLNRKYLFIIFFAVLSLFWYLTHDWLLDSFELYRIYYKRFFQGRELGDFQNLLYGRGILSIIENPQYLILGAGEGHASRFGHKFWIHNSLLNIMFSYGILGITLFVLFIKKCCSKYDNWWIIILPLFAASIFTEITHNLHFWIIIAIMMSYSIHPKGNSQFPYLFKIANN